jgi:hypothetical protein
MAALIPAIAAAQKSYYTFPMKRTASLLYFIIFLFCAAALASCASRPVIDTAEDEQNIPQSLYVPPSFDWQNVCKGIDRFDFENKTLPVRYHAVRIDLGTDGLEPAAFPGTALNDAAPRMMRTADFAEKYDCTAAMNAAPFTPSKKIVGVHIASAREYSPCVERYCALVLKKDPETGKYHASITDHQTEAAVQGAEYAFGGFFTILCGGSKKEFRISRHDSRSGAGISADGRMLYLLVVEGERPQHSTGLSYPQCADIFRAMGCTDAMEFDGGSSSDLCICGKSVLSYVSAVVQGSSFGFRVRE